MNPILVKNTGLFVLLLLAAGRTSAQNALTIEGASLYLEAGASLYVQGDLENKSTGSFINNGTVSVTGNLVHNGSLNLNATNTGLFRLNGTTNQLISGSKQINFYDLSIDKSAGECQLQAGFTLLNQLTLTNGNLFLNSQQIDLLTTGLLIGETSARRIYDVATGTGTIRIVNTLNAPSSANPGNLGAILTSSQNLGSTTIIRGHTQQFIISANSITRYYDISPTNNTGLNATLRFNYFDAELNGQPEDELVQFHSTMNNTVWIKRGGTRNMASNYVDLSSVDSFTRVSLVSHKVSPLPLKLLSFTATKTASSDVLLEWKTVDEVQCSHFDIERSANGTGWIKIGATPAAGQAGTVQHYQFTDLSPFTGTNYYRLKQVDMDGGYTYSPVRLINFNGESNVSVYPTITRSNSLLFITGISPEQALIEIYDNNGRLLSRANLYSNSTRLPQLPAGNYHIRVINILSGKAVATQQIFIY